MKAKLLIDGKEIEVNISEEEYKKLQSPKEKKTGYERVTEYNTYYYVAAKGVVEFAVDERDCFDDAYYEVANYYSSEIVAKNNARADKLMRQLRRFSVENRENEINWNNTEDIKFYIIYEQANSHLRAVKGALLQPFGGVYFDSEELARTAIDKFHDELIWYFTEYNDSL